MLLKKIKDTIAELDHWTDKQETKETVDIVIRDTLWQELPLSYTDEALERCHQNVYDFVFSRYSGNNNRAYI